MDEIIRLYCNTCENSNCTIGRAYIPEDSNEGCTRRVPEVLLDSYTHLIDEVSPFMYMDTKKEYQDNMYKQIIDTLYKIYDCPVGAKIKPQKHASRIGNM